MLPQQLNRLAMDLQRPLSRLVCPFVGWGDRVDVRPPGHLIDRSAELLILYRGSDDHQTIGEAANRRHRWVVAGEGSILVDSLGGLEADDSNAAHGLTQLQEQIADGSVALCELAAC